ncbi:MAG TPA: ATP-binding cassette domain-containing protein [bacterium]|nr:ATP-binding cassette domain-containing protein [bacterium]
MIEVQNVTKTFRLSRARKRETENRSRENILTAVSGLSFSCRPGRVFTLLGPNGAGKTTLLRILATMMRPTAGSVRVCGFDTVHQAAEVRRRLGFMTGDTGLYDRLTPTELVRYYADLFGLPRDRYLENRDSLFGRLGIHDFADRRIGKLSSGMKQKVSIARTMIHDPEVVVFDEPTAGLDVITARAIIDLIHDCRDTGKTVIFSTHIMSEVSLVSDDLAVIHRGRLRYCGDFKAFRSQMRSDSLEGEFIRILGETP